jgi:cell division protein FtsN
MNGSKIVLGLCCALVLALSGCSRQQSDWQKTRETNTTDSYEQFLKKYPSGEFTAQAQARVKELYEERDWQKARDADTPEAYQAFLKQYPEGKWTEEARIRVENFTLAQAPSGTGSPPVAGADPSAVVAGTPGNGESATPETAPATPAVVAPKAPVHATAPTPAKAPPSSPAMAQQAPKPAKAAASGASGSYGIQLGAYKSGAAAAHERWANLQKQYPALLSGLTSKVAPKKGDSGTLYRLQAVGLTEKHARDICGALKAKSEACVVVAPSEG